MNVGKQVKVKGHAKALSAAMLLSSFAFSANHAVAKPRVGDIYQMELEQLMDVTVTSVNKRTSSLAESAAAVYIITNEHIRRSGAVSLPEVLSLAPGVDVVKTNASTWGVGVRGFNGQYSNKLLVLVDGRSIYSVVAGSVSWDVAMPLLDDIERIEVIRGPGASLWGSNAVNGVISIITKSAKNTQGNHFVVGVGTEEKSYSRLRHGGTLDSGASYRVYGQTLDRDSSVDDETGDDSEDGYAAYQLGWRVDWQLGDGQFSVQGEWYDLDKEYNPLIDDLLVDEVPKGGFDEHIYGGHILAHWSKPIANHHQIDVQISIDKTVRNESIFKLEAVNTDVDFQHTLPITADQQFTWGLSYRTSYDDFRGKYFVDLDDDSQRYDRATMFFQEEVSFSEEWALVLGIKLEETEFSSFDNQPTIRMLWTPVSTFTGWAAVSKANRTPNRVGKGMSLRFGDSDDIPGLERYVLGNEEFQSETLFAYESGIRSQLSSSVFIDLSGFYFEYENLRTFDIIAPTAWGEPAYFIYDNKARGYSHGGELVMEWKPISNLSLNLQYSYFDFVSSPEPEVLGDGAGVIVFEQQEVNNIAALRCEYTFEGGVEFDWALKYRDGMDLDEVDSHTDLDVRVAWRYSPQLILSVIGKNIAGKKRLEFTDSLMAPRWSQIEPSAALQVDMHL